MKNKFAAYEWNNTIRDLCKDKVTFGKHCEEILTTEQKLKIANSKLASIELIMLDYYNGEFDTIGDLAGAISFVLNGDWGD